VRELLGKRDFLLTVNKLSRCHNPQKAWTPQQPFHSKLLNPEILHQILSIVDFMSVKSDSS